MSTKHISILLERGQVEDPEGNVHALHSGTSLEQCRFLQDLARSCGAQNCVEIGLAFGLSALALCEVLAEQKAGKLLAIDPFQQAHYHNAGRHQLELAGYSNRFEHIEDFSHNALPKLAANGASFDFAYVDTTKLFDVVLVDALFLTRMLKVGGIIVFDDCAWPSLRKLIRYVSQWPHLEPAGLFGPTRDSAPLRLAQTLAAPLRRSPLRHCFANRVIQPDHLLGVAGSCIAFRKIGEDLRPYD